MLNHEKEDCPQNKSQANMKSTPIISLNLLQKKESLLLRTNTGERQPSIRNSDHRQTSGFMRGAKRSGYDNNSLLPRNYHHDSASYDDNIRSIRSNHRTRHEAQYPSASLQVSSHKPTSSRWVDTGRRISPSGHSLSRDKSPAANPTRDCEHSISQQSSPQFRDKTGEGMATSSLRVQGRSLHLLLRRTFLST